MFVCSECIEPEGRSYFMIMLPSYGKCEMCGQITSCADIHDYSVVKEIEGESSIP